MSVLLAAKELKSQASLVDFLDKLGYQPARKNGKEKMYNSMLRENDRKPSLSVNDELGVWFDHGTRRGGNIVDLAIALWPNLSFGEVVLKIQEVCNVVVGDKRPQRPRRAVRVPNYIITETKPIGNHPAITDYLKKRMVFDAAANELQEVYYYVQDEKGLKKDYYAAGWKNERGAWEVRNKYFKGCLGSKAISFIPAHPKKAAIFEGFMDYLSWKHENPLAEHSIIVLNTIALLNEGIEKAKLYSSLDTYFDRDAPGLEASRKFVQALPYATDRSIVFEGYNDYNDKLVAAAKNMLIRHGVSVSRDSKIVSR